MTDQEKRIKIAEACERPELAQCLACDATALCAMHQAQWVLMNNPELWQRYVDNLVAVCGTNRNAMVATADARAEAFGKTLNLW